MAREDVITLGDVARVARVVRWHALAGLLIGALLAIAASFLVRPVFQAQTTVLPATAKDKGALGDLPAQFSGLAALAGIDPGSSEEKTRSIELLKSKSLVQKFIETHRLMPVLFPEEWNAARNAWRDEGDAPTLAEAIRKFQDDVRRVSQDRRTSVVTVTMEWFDPALAQRWANDFVRMANEEIRSRAIREAQATLSYLNEQIAKTSVVGVREALFRLVEAQLKTEALAKVRDDYAFQVVDPAFPPDEEDIVRPQRPLFALLGGLLGAGLAGWMRHLRLRKPRS
ncbi:MAG: Wzz/FepE/Etk N-terminal domain-containing protein [Steroidobacteraceae bacterium]